MSEVCPSFCAKIVGFIKNLFTLSIFCLLALRTMGLHKVQVPVQVCAGLCEISKDGLWNPKNGHKPKDLGFAPDWTWQITFGPWEPRPKRCCKIRRCSANRRCVSKKFRKQGHKESINLCARFIFAFLALAVHGLFFFIHGPSENFCENFWGNFCQKFLRKFSARSFRIGPILKFIFLIF